MNLYKKEELKDARIFFDKSPPSFMTMFIFFLLFVMVLSIIISSFVDKPYVVRAQGVVAVDQTSYVASKGFGVINQVHAKSGDYVEEGDTVLVISSGNEGAQATVIQEQIADLEQTIAAMDKYKTALMEKENTLAQTGKELEYYGKVNYYLTLLSQEGYEKGSVNDQRSKKLSEQSALDKEILDIQTQLQQLGSTNNNDKELDKTLQQQHASRAKLEKEISSLEQEIVASKEELDSDLTAIQTQLEEKMGALDAIVATIANVEDELVQIRTTNDTNHSKKIELESRLEMKISERDALSNEVDQIEQQINAPSSRATDMLNQLLSELGQSRNQIESKIVELNATLVATKGQDAIHHIKANQSGVLHFLNPLAEGMSIQQNQILGEIASEEEDFYIDAYIPAQDRSRVATEDAVKVSIVGVNSHRFGSLSGTVDFIEPGTLKNESSQEPMIFYRARIKLKETSLESKSGEEIELIRSMPVEARVVYKSESYLDWVINLLNLK